MVVFWGKSDFRRIRKDARKSREMLLAVVRENQPSSNGTIFRMMVRPNGQSDEAELNRPYDSPLVQESFTARIEQQARKELTGLIRPTQRLTNNRGRGRLVFS
jgi:hypothetical protein